MTRTLIFLVGGEVDDFFSSLDSINIIVFTGEEAKRVDALLAAHEGWHEVDWSICDSGFDFLIVNEGLEEYSGAVIVEKESVIKLWVVLPQVLTLEAHLLFINRTKKDCRFLNVEENFILNFMSWHC